MVLSSILFTACKKYLDKQPDKTIVIPHSVADLQAVLDAYGNMNWGCTDIDNFSSGDYYINSSDWSTIAPRDVYIWDKAAFYDNAWFLPYRTVLNANVVLDELPTMADANNESANNVRGQALFFRAFCFHHLAQVFCKPYSSATAPTDLGIVLRLTADLNVKSGRSTVQQTYDQIISDLKTAAPLLPQTNITPVRPNKAAAYGMLARVYLSMRDYPNAGKYADSCLSLNSSLLDYNSLNYTSSMPIPMLNNEIIFWAKATDIGGSGIYKIDSALFRLYDPNDLRKLVFFQKNSDSVSYWFKGSYTGIYNEGDFPGIATDEMYLTRAEAFARAGNTAAAMADLNTLLNKRWKINTFTNLTGTDATDALSKILTERRKELLFRGLRWMDLRRLNLEGSNITLTRVINGTTYTLPPNDPRWVLLIPPDVISLSGIQQNPR